MATTVQYFAGKSEEIFQFGGLSWRFAKSPNFLKFYYPWCSRIILVLPSHIINRALFFSIAQAKFLIDLFFNFPIWNLRTGFSAPPYCSTQPVKSLYPNVINILHERSNKLFESNPIAFIISVLFFFFVKVFTDPTLSAVLQEIEQFCEAGRRIPLCFATT